MRAATEKRVIGVDVGGANLKYAAVDRTARSRSFAMWRDHRRLAEAIRDDLTQLGSVDAVAVTMTGELADCFVDRSEGVQSIVDAVCRAAGDCGIDEIAFYAVDGRFRNAQQARRDVDLVAAANWHALATFVGKRIASDATLVDIGSTTTDIIPIVAGRVGTEAQTDFQRLQQGSLVYVGCSRTPVCGLLDRMRFRGQWTGVMNELFATVDDARIVLGLAEENAAEHDTADGKPRTCEFAANRLARMIGLDRRSVSPVDAQELASQVVAAAQRRLSESFAAVDRGGLLVCSGHGDDLLRLPEDRTTIRLIDQLGAAVSRCAPSFAVAWLWTTAKVQTGERCEES